MNNIKLSNHVRLIAFFLTGAVLICTFGLTVDGWQSSNNYSKNDEHSGNISLPDMDDEIKYTNRLTGLPTTEIISKSIPFAFVIDNIDSCGISSCDLLIEIPIENGKSRYLTLVSDISELQKIGSITCTRGYINNLINYFGALGIYNGSDDIINYDSFNDVGENWINLSMKKDYCYTENKDRIYTNCNLIGKGIKDMCIDTDIQDQKKLPFDFTDNATRYEKQALEVTSALSKDSFIKLKYNSERGKYSYYNDDTQNADSPLEFVNCFVLFADFITYDKTSGTQTVVDTLSGGTGFFLTNGTYTSIKWSADSSGILNFYLENNERLYINIGNSYIGLFKSSSTSSVLFK